MQSLKERDQSSCLRWTQVLSICRHVAATLNYLANQLVLGEPHCHAIESGSSLSATLSKRVAIAALLDLKDQRPLSFKRGRVMNISIRHGITTPRIHVRTPGHKPGEMGEGPQRECDQQHGQNRDWTALPTLFTFTRKKRKKQQTGNDHHRSDQ